MSKRQKNKNRAEALKLIAVIVLSAPIFAISTLLAYAVGGTL